MIDEVAASGDEAADVGGVVVVFDDYVLPLQPKSITDVNNKIANTNSILGDFITSTSPLPG